MADAEQQKDIEKLDENEKKVFQQVFVKIDTDQSNTVSREECVAFMKGDSEKANEMFEDLEANGDGLISMEEWLSFFGRLKSNTAESWTAIFQWFEEQASN